MLLGKASTMLAMSALALAQIPMGMPNGNGSQNGGNGSGSNSGSSSNPAPNPLRIMRSAANGELSRGAGSAADMISGRVLLSGGGEAGENILVQRMCGSAVTGETRTDSAGRFLLPRTPSRTVDTDASQTTGGTWGCEVRASLPGYQTGSVPLGNGRTAEGGEVVILLHAAGILGGMTVSATTLLAPKDARKSYDKGLDALRRNEPDVAQKSLMEAVKEYPRFAAAWFELGKLYEQRGHQSEARAAYGKSTAADGAYLFPYVRLCRMEIRAAQWKEAAADSNKILRLDPYEFPEAYYLNAVSNLQLNNLDAAERSAREAAKLEGVRAEPRGNYVLGVILWRKGDLDGAQEKMQSFLDGSPSGPQLASAKKALARIEELKQSGQARQSQTETSHNGADTPLHINFPPAAQPDR